MIFLRNSLYVSICCLSLVLPTLVHADAPVVDATSQDSNDNSNADSADYANTPNANSAVTNNNNSFPSAAVPNINSATSSTPPPQPQSDNNSSNSSYDTSSMSLNDRVAQLERQIANMNQLNLLGQVNQLQQQVQDLTGQLETATHNLQVLQNQQKNQYADLDQRLSKLESPSAKTIPTNNSNSSANNNVDTTTSGDNQQPTTDNTNPSSSDDAKTTSQNNATTSDNQISNNLQEQNDYQKAYNLIKNKDYTGATSSMVQFLKQYPNSSYALNAHYWLGEMYLLQNMPGQAASEFSTVINKYPQNPKTGDAMLKLGFAYADQQKWPQARKQLLLVSSRFSGSTTGQLATERLKEMKLQGH